MPEPRQPLDHVPTRRIQKFYDKNKALFDQYPELRVGWDNKSAVPGGHEINIGGVGPDAVGVRANWTRNLRSTSPRVKSSRQRLRPAHRISELSNRRAHQGPERREPVHIPGFEHITKKVYDNLEPDERDYLKGDKLTQRSVMTQYHKIAPSVNETTNAMQAGAALGGWWKRYIDVFHGLLD